MSSLSEVIANTTRAAPKNHAKQRKRASKPTPREQLIIFALGDHERYGLAIQSAISECSNGTESITIGTLYPMLQNLEKKGLIISRAGTEVSSERCDRKRKYFRLTNEGKAVLADILAYQKKLLSWDG
ncbi:MAG: PadR family transcriptional regulator [Cyanobacteria bacterium J06576_12]